MTADRIDEILRRLPILPDTATVPVAVAAKHENVSEKTIRRRYPLVQLTVGRYGVSVGFLRNRSKAA